MSLHSPENLLETADRHPIVFGGPSSSQALNDIAGNLVQDLSDLYTRVDALEERQDDLLGILEANAAGLDLRIQELQLAVNAVVTGAAPVSAFADLFESSYVYDQSPAGMVNATYGQATLPVKSTTEKLTARDVNGTVWVPRTTAVATYVTTASGDLTGSETFTLDPDFVRALDGRTDTAWILNARPEGETGDFYVWVRITLPIQLNAARRANALVLHPCPIYGSELLLVRLKGPRDYLPDDTVALAYHPGYDADRGEVTWFGNTRLLFAPQQVTEVLIKLRVRAGFDRIGFQHLGVQLLDFETMGTLTLDFRSFGASGDLAFSQLYGKGAGAELALLSPEPVATEGVLKDGLRIMLSQSEAWTSPVITGASVTFPDG